MRRFSPTLVVLVAAAALVAAPAAHAAEPSSGTVTKKDDATWSGGPFLVPNPAACLTAGDPLCDHFLLTVDAKDGAHVAVAVSTAAPDADDFDLAVYAPDGTLLASSATSGGNESLVFEHLESNGGGPYEVRVQPWLVSMSATYDGFATVTRDPIDVERECLEATPDAVSIDFTDNVHLDTMVLLDGVSRERGDELMGVAATSYAPMNVTLDWSLRTVDFATDDADELIQAAKDKFKGTRPNGFDLVYVLTDKDIQLGGDTGVAGLADCIGGVRYPEHAFAVGEDFGAETDGGTALGPFVHTTNGSAVVVAHELGHLMGAHHHYGNCVQGLSLEDVENMEITPCTLMFNFVNFASLPFGTLNTAVVRGHTLEYATP